MEKDKLWTREFVSISLIGLFLFLTFNVLLNILPLYLAGPLQQGTDKVGLVITIFLVSAILVRPFVSQWVHRYSLKKLLVISDLGFLIATILYPFATNVWALLVLRFFHGITFGIITTIAATICTKVIPVSRRGEGIGYYSMTTSITMVIGPYIAIELANRNAFMAAFILCIVVSVFRYLLVLKINVPEEKRNPVSSKIVEKITLEDLFDKKAAPYALSIFVMALAYSSIPAFLALYAKSIGLQETASYFFVIYALVVLVSRTFTGRLSDKLGVNVVFYPCLVFYAVGMLLLSQTFNASSLLVSGAILGLGYGAVTPVIQTQTINAVPPQRVVAANSLYFNSLDCGMALGSYLWGVLAIFTTYRNIYLLGMVLVIFAGIQYYVLIRKKAALQGNM